MLQIDMRGSFHAKAKIIIFNNSLLAITVWMISLRGRSFNKGSLSLIEQKPLFDWKEHSPAESVIRLLHSTVQATKAPQKNWSLYSTNNEWTSGFGSLTSRLNPNIFVYVYIYIIFNILFTWNQPNLMSYNSCLNTVPSLLIQIQDHIVVHHWK
jgi:preprotein translocase subunit SecY